MLFVKSKENKFSSNIIVLSHKILIDFCGSDGKTWNYLAFLTYTGYTFLPDAVFHKICNQKLKVEEHIKVHIYAVQYMLSKLGETSGVSRSSIKHYYYFTWVVCVYDSENCL